MKKSYLEYVNFDKMNNEDLIDFSWGLIDLKSTNQSVYEYLILNWPDYLKEGFKKDL